MSSDDDDTATCEYTDSDYSSTDDDSSSESDSEEDTDEEEDPPRTGSVTIVRGDLLNAKEQYICHQCNCTSKKAKGLAKTIFNRFPWSKIYHKDRSAWLGDIRVSKSPVANFPSVIHMFAQDRPGGHKGSANVKLARRMLFKGCLEKIAKIPGVESLAFPKGIGCGLAGGDWDAYLAVLTTFAMTYGIRVRIYCQ
jgi:O-acetyl-ADP-ribose deacetylase (regulator of RNase III)